MVDGDGRAVGAEVLGLARKRRTEIREIPFYSLTFNIRYYEICSVTKVNTPLSLEIVRKKGSEG